MDLKSAVSLTDIATIKTSELKSPSADTVYYLFGNIEVDGLNYEIDYDITSNTIQLYDPRKFMHLGDACTLAFRLDREEDISLNDFSVKIKLPILLGTSFGFEHPKTKEAFESYLNDSKKSAVGNLDVFIHAKDVDIKYECGIEGLVMYGSITLYMYGNGVKVVAKNGETYLTYLKDTPIDSFISAVIGDIEYLLSMNNSYDKNYVTVSNITLTNNDSLSSYITKLLDY